ncbi:hypothetical protein SprV_0200857400 [Sparganum proliferum]
MTGMNTCLLFVCCLFSWVHSGEAQSRGYDRIFGSSAVRKYCAEENESCMFETNCCPGLYCVTRGSQGMCQSKSQLRNRCFMDKDCPPSMCCHWGDAGSLGTCAEVCDDAPPTDVPVGSYRGSDFWRLWARKRQLHGKRRLTVE